ncbi:unnamed protein product [Rotaria sp. Silwood2]|nr:unnamed protein product [Rotaria sp. Silwood2]CAF2768001.1 unnamed protein product [Rotaria sp. Silwood2]CAF3926562.1 unnamed protein product [Rotaria sp. Silwood2]
MKTTVDIYNDNDIWDDPDLDFVPIEYTTPNVLNNFTTSTTLIDHVDFINEISPSSTIVDGLATLQPNLTLNWWESNDTLLSSSFISSTVLSSTLETDKSDAIILNTTSIPAITRFEHLLDDDGDDDDDDDDIENDSEEIDEIDEELFTSSTDLNSDIDVDINDNSFSPTLTTTSVIDFIYNYRNNNNNTQPFDPFDFYNETKDHLLEHMKPLSTVLVPPLLWVLNMVTPSKSQFLNTTIASKKQNEETMHHTTSKTSDIFYEYCKNKQCYHGGRLNSDCLCICLPAFTGDNCETVLCEQEPTHICAFILEHECQTDYIQYLCPKFCQMNNCSSLEM